MTTPALVAAVLVALGVGVAAGTAIGTFRGRARVRRLSEGLEQMAGGNYGHRIILAGDDEAARAAMQANTLADAVQRDLEAASARERARVRLLANISHDLRTPITSIAGYVDAIERGLGEEPARYLSVIASKTDELAQLTDDLFYEARLESGDLDLKLRAIDLAEATRRCLLGFEPQLTAEGVRAEIDVPDGTCAVQGDPSAIDRILSNIVSNALRHGAGMSVFAVSLVQDGSGCRVSIANDGPPLPDDAEQLFERGVTGPAGGAGLGLSIARDLAERMRGSITAANRPDGRVIFALTLPRATETPR